MEIYKLGTRWGSGQPSFYEMIKRRGIIIMDSNRANPDVGDVVVITDEYTVLAIAKVLEKLKPVTEDKSLIKNFASHHIDYGDWVVFAPAEWYELTEDEQFQYELQKGISFKSEYIRKKVTYLFNNYLETKNKESLGAIEKESKGTEISQPFDPKDIKVEIKHVSLDSIIRRLETNRINLDAEDQRPANFWGDVQKSRLIESILLQLPLSAFYFSSTEDDSWEVIDGLQRLSAIQHFVLGYPEKNKLELGKNKLKLQGLEYLTQLNEKTFDELPFELKSRIEEANITVYLLRPGTPEDIIYNLFQRINTRELTLPEIRNTLNKGIPAQYVKELAEDAAFTKATNHSIPTNKMEDRDFIIRFISFYLFDYYKDYQPDLDTFLNKGMRTIKILSQEQRQDIKIAFIQSMNLAYTLFGKDAFRKKYGIDDNQKKPINKALFEVLSVCFAKLQPFQVEKLIAHKDSFNTAFFNIFNDQLFVNAISVNIGDRNSVRNRYDTIVNLIQNTLNHDN